jgi:hypothetical protein
MPSQWEIVAKMSAGLLSSSGLAACHQWIDYGTDARVTPPLSSRGRFQPTIDARPTAGYDVSAGVAASAAEHRIMREANRNRSLRGNATAKKMDSLLPK